MEVEKIKETAKDFIKGKTKKSDLKRKISNFFSGKSHKDIHEFDPNFIVSLRDAKNVLGKNKLSKSDKAYVDYLFNNQMVKYVAISICQKFNEEKLKSLTRLIFENSPFSEKKRMDFLEFVGWTWAYREYLEGIEMNTSEKDLFFRVSVWEKTNEEREIDVFSCGSKKHKWFLNEVGSVFEDGS